MILKLVKINLDDMCEPNGMILSHFQYHVVHYLF